MKGKNMSRKIVVVNHAFTEKMRTVISDTAKQYGMETHFYEKNADALGDMADAEVAFGKGADLMKAGKKLKWFCSQSAGVDAYMKPGVIQNEDMLLTNSSGAYGMALAEHTMMLTLALLRHLPEYYHMAESHQWAKELIPMQGIVGSRVTILGTGDLGTEIAKRFRAFVPSMIVGINRSGRDRKPDFDKTVSQDKTNDILPETDILIMALPGTDETKHFISDERIALLPKHAVIINVGRGNALDSEALMNALKKDQIFGATLDVFEKEPLEENNPMWTCPHLLITPHVAGNMTLPYTVQKTCDQFVEDLKNYAEGKTLQHLVNRGKGY